MRKKRKRKNNNNCRPYVVVGKQSIEKAISQFKKRVKNSGLLLELRNREFYEKKSAAKRRRKKLNILRNKYNTTD